MKPAPWSFSRITSFLNCPHAFAEIQVYRNFQDVQGDAAKWGERGHKHIENHINGGPLHDDLDPYARQIFETFEQAGGLEQRNGIVVFAEYQAALNRDLQPVDWFAADVWLRGVLDFLRIEGEQAWVSDWKFGKVKPNSRQLKLFALLVFYHFPQVRAVHTRFDWLQFKTRTPTTGWDTYFLTDVLNIWNEFMPDLRSYATAFKTETWQPRPSGLCRKHCAVLSCVHNGRG